VVHFIAQIAGEMTLEWSGHLEITGAKKSPPLFDQEINISWLYYDNYC
jgi:hypothetical protein